MQRSELQWGAKGPRGVGETGLLRLQEKKQNKNISVLKNQISFYF
jgi:hypothetical protein